MTLFDYPTEVGTILTPAQRLEFALYWPKRSPELYVVLDKDTFPEVYADGFDFDDKKCAAYEQIKDDFLLVTKTRYFFGRFYNLAFYGRTKGKTPVFNIKENRNVTVLFKR